MTALDSPPLSPAQPAVVGYAPIGPVRDTEHIKLLKVLHYVFGSFVLAGSCLFIIHIALGVAALTDPNFLRPRVRLSTPASTLPTTTAPVTAIQPVFTPGFAWFMLCMGIGGLTAGWTVGILTLLSGRYLGKRRNRTFSLVVAGINCLAFPFGTTLGVFTFIVLLRDSVAELYGESPNAQSGVGVRR